MNKLTSTLLFVVTLILFVFTLIGNHGLLRLHRIDAELQELSNNNSKLMSEIVGLENRIFALRSSKQTLEKDAREQLGLSKPGEIVYIFSDAEKNNHE